MVFHTNFTISQFKLFVHVMLPHRVLTVEKPIDCSRSSKLDWNYIESEF